jgi:hypothetical protein
MVGTMVTSLIASLVLLTVGPMVGRLDLLQENLMVALSAALWVELLGKLMAQPTVAYSEEFSVVVMVES